MFKYYALGILVLALLWSVYNQRDFFDAPTTTPLGSVCDFQQGPCSKELLGNKISLSAQPQIIKSEQQVVFRLYSDGLNQSVRISGFLEGRDMYMGKIPLFFDYKNGAFYADTMIGACLEDSMVWTMRLSIEHQGGEQQLLTYEFVSYQ